LDHFPTGVITERIFGYAPRLTLEKLRVAEALEELPATARELETGRVCFSAVRELTRVATRFTEEEWLAASRGRTVREVERLVSGHRPGSRPEDPRDPGAMRHVVRLELSPEGLATLREAMAKVRRDAGGPLDDDATILLMARQILEGPRAEGRASYQVAMTRCEDCKRGWQQGRGELVEVAPSAVAMAACDEQRVGAQDTHVGKGEERASRARQSVTPATRRTVLRRDTGRCRVPGCRHSTFVDVHHVQPRSDGGANDPENLVTLCAAHHRAIHAGKLLVQAGGSREVRFFHADGSQYGCPISPGAADLRAKAFVALRGMGFRESEVRRALAQAQTSEDLHSELKELVRASLHVLTAA
jgi:hypothetical protein